MSEKPVPILPDEHLHEVNVARMSAYYATIQTRNAGIFDLSLLGLKSLIILNGGAIIAMFTLLGHFDQLTLDPVFLWWGFAAFITGTVVALLAILAGYLAQNTILNLEYAEAESLYMLTTIGKTTIQLDRKIGNLQLSVAICFAFLSVLAFTVGAGLSLKSASLKSKLPAAASANAPPTPAK